jgi:hypothetical protein
MNPKNNDFYNDYDCAHINNYDNSPDHYRLKAFT